MSQPPPPDPADRPGDGRPRRPLDLGKPAGESVDRTQEIPPMPAGAPAPQPGPQPPPQGRPAGPPAGPQQGGPPPGWRPAPAPQYAPPGMAPMGRVAKAYNPFLPALAAGIITAGLTVGLGKAAMSLVRQGNEALGVVGWLSAYFDIRRVQTFAADIPTSHVVVAAAVSAVVVLVLTLLAAATTRCSGARGLIFFAVWGITGLGSAVASLVVGIAMEGMELNFTGFVTMVNPAAGWGIVLGWIPALAAVALRIGRAAKT